VNLRGDILCPAAGQGGWASRARAQSLPQLFRAAALLLCCLASAPSQQAPAENAFTDRAAARMVRQLAEALEGHSEKKLLALFDLSRMAGGPLFRGQISSFLSHSESIRIHLNLVELAAENAKAGFTADAEMEVQPGAGGQPWRRNERLAFTVARAGKEWRFTGIQPRSFFSLP
jgi:hypothetical protein